MLVVLPTTFGQDFPIPATPTKYYLGAAGALGLDTSEAQGCTEIVADPELRADNGTGSVGFPGARDARSFEAQQPYVQTFTTPVSEPLRLFASNLNLCNRLGHFTPFASRRLQHL